MAQRTAEVFYTTCGDVCESVCLAGEGNRLRVIISQEPLQDDCQSHHRPLLRRIGLAGRPPPSPHLAKSGPQEVQRARDHPEDFSSLDRTALGRSRKKSLFKITLHEDPTSKALPNFCG